MRAYEIGEQSYSTFKSRRLEKDPPTKKLNVQRIKGDQATFSDIAATVFSKALNEERHSKQIDVVFDTYQKNCIKNSERLLRGGETGHQWQSITSTQIVRQWRIFLSIVFNKTNLVTYSQ